MIRMANSRKGKAAAVSALNHFREIVGDQGDGDSTDAEDLIANLLLTFEPEVAAVIIERAAGHWETDRHVAETE